MESRDRTRGSHSRVVRAPTRGMFLDATTTERSTFLKQAEGRLMPGYTGHCPTLKFKFGKRYGANTKEIIQELSLKDISHPPKPYRQTSEQVPRSSLPREYDVYGSGMSYRRRPRQYILGYTGYIPGMNFRYGTSFRRAADDSMTEFSRRISEEHKDREHNRRAHSAPKMDPIHTKEEVKKALLPYEHRAHSESHISPECPPIAGYTGHIPRLRVTEASLSQRFNMAARKGLLLLREERQRRNEMQDAAIAVQRALDDYKMPSLPLSARP